MLAQCIAKLLGDKIIFIRYFGDAFEKIVEHKPVLHTFFQVSDITTIGRGDIAMFINFVQDSVNGEFCSVHLVKGIIH